MSLQEKTFLLPGPAGDQEVITTTGILSKTAIICHPHPLHGGTMTNKVVTTLMQTFRSLGLSTIRFNFRGVGKSQGQFADGIGEVEDLLSIADWVKINFPDNAIWLAGFSFGGYVAARASTIIHPEKLITVAPQVSRFIQDKLPQITAPWIIVQGDQDEIVSSEQVFAWAETLTPKPAVIRIPDAGHFFHGQLTVLKEKLLAAL